MSSSAAPASRQGIANVVAAQQPMPGAAPDTDNGLLEPANAWSRIRYTYKEEFAEFLGCFMLLLFGSAVDCQVVLAGAGNYLSINFGWAAGVAIGVWVSGGISGGHVNPAVTLSMAIFRRFPWKKVPSYIAAQILGCMAGTFATYFAYRTQIILADPSGTLLTSRLFHAFPGQPIGHGSMFFTEVLATGVLVSVIYAISDRCNLPPQKGQAPVAIFILILGIGSSLGINTGYGMNPARDLGPRLALGILGFKGGMFTHNRLYWLWNGVGAPILGALIGAFVYDTLIYSGIDSPLNKSNSKQGRIRLPDNERDV